MKGTDMPTTPRVWISPQAHERLHRELDTLRFLFSAGIADGDTDENAAAVRRAWEVRIQQIHDLLINAVVGEDPPNDGIAEPGMVGHRGRASKSHGRAAKRSRHRRCCLPLAKARAVRLRTTRGRDRGSDANPAQHRTAAGGGEPDRGCAIDGGTASALTASGQVSPKF